MFPCSEAEFQFGPKDVARYRVCQDQVSQLHLSAENRSRGIISRQFGPVACYVRVGLGGMESSFNVLYSGKRRGESQLWRAGEEAWVTEVDCKMRRIWSQHKTKQEPI